MQCEIRETQLPDQTRDTICINFAGKIVRLEAHSSEWLFTLLEPTVRKYYLNVKIHKLFATSQDIPRGFAERSLHCRLLDSPSKLIKAELKGSFPRVYIPDRYYALLFLDHF